MRKHFMGILLILAFSLGLLTACSSPAGSGEYYVQVDNSRMEEGRARNGVIDFTGGMAYRYTLPAYNAQGEEQEISFGASKELRDGAFLRLTVKPVRGVVNWEELSYEALPSAVQQKFAPPEETLDASA